MKLDDLLQDWESAKAKLKKYEEIVESRRKAVMRYMLDKQTKEIKTSHYSVKMSTATRETLTKKDVPREIWDKYSKKVSYETCVLRKRGAKGSPDRT